MSWKLNYKGDVVDSVMADLGAMYGPSEPPLEETFVATSAVYDAETDRTTVTFKPVARKEAIVLAANRYSHELEQLQRLDRVGLLNAAIP
ncbi:hypothetical protein SEA_NORVS_128 [Gordonia phage Norvs]|nr:hypothetical protein SEA_NORVS_128 [Gordonia phage Norvs]WKW85928.1 hypothetical protein SEA_PHINKBODEN_129 [Gordonia Phage PhinkBoden]WNM66399.1 hypothetical protein SEA_CULVER_129 [Gordonia phage Culver]